MRRNFNWTSVWGLPLLLVAVALLRHVSSSSSPEGDSSTYKEDDFDEELYSVIHSVRDGSLWTISRRARSIEPNRTVANETLSDNSLWNDLWFECRRKASFSCIRTGVFKYLDKSLEKANDLRLTDSLLFSRNKNKVNGFCENSEEEKEKCLRYNREKLKVRLAGTRHSDTRGNSSQTTTTTTTTQAGNELGDEGKESTVDLDTGTVNATAEKRNSTDDTMVASSSEEEDEGQEDESDEDEDADTDGRSVNSLSELSDILYDKGAHFLMTHDTEFQLPELFFGGGSIKIEPKSYVEGDENEEEGALVKIVFKPPPPPPNQPIIKGRVIHHLKRLFKKKLMHSFMALMLVIKMIKVKLMFLLPMIIGKATAKKLLLKVLLFLIPGLAHLFKLCHYYHQEHAKYHHHHHKVKHHHHHIKVPVPVPVPVHVDHHNHIDSSYGPSGYDYPPYPPSHSGGLDSDYDYGSYNKDYGSLSHFSDNEAHLSSWGLGASNYHEAGVLDAKNQPLYYKNHPYGAHYPDHLGSHSQRYTTKLQALTPKPPLEGPPVPAGYDPFYSPILQKIDSIFIQLNFNDEPCRERLICSMYKTPHRFSPHSNLLSHELSRDARELQKPVGHNTAVLRFYRYVQAARDGQDRKDCLRLYPNCPINTE